MAAFIHLRIHTEYSIYDGLLQIEAVLAKAADLGMPALGISDLGNLFAVIKFYQAAFEHGIKPIIGADLWLASEGEANPASRLTLFCQNMTGYQNLIKLVSRSYLEGHVNGPPQIKKAWLQPQTVQGLIALCGQEGNIGQALLNHNLPQAETCLQAWQALFPGTFYLEITRLGKAGEEDYLYAALALAEQHAIPVVATNEVCFLEKDDFEAHDTRVCIQAGTTLNDPLRSKKYTQKQYLRSAEEMQILFADLPEALANSLLIAKRCNVTFDLGKPLLPFFTVPTPYTTETYLRQAAQEGLTQRLKTLFAQLPASALENTRQTYEKRLQHELDVITSKGFAGYFLIVADFTRWAKDNGIPVGPGRGSGPGSLVAYALNITDLDPLAFELIFERFLNSERISLPDFDIDFCMEGRDKVIEYVMQRHGKDSVAQIITYGTMAAKAVVRDVGRALALSYGFVDKIAKLIPFELGMTLAKALEQEPLLKERYQQDDEVRNLIDLARKLEGVTRNVGKHAGGIVIAPGKLTDFVPLYWESDEARGHAVTQFDKHDVETVGLVKFDFLGLKTLTIIDRSLKIINQQRQQQQLPVIDINLIPLQDHITFNLLKNCQTTAVFQLESYGMRDLIKRLQPDRFEDLIALVALFRPGPLQSGMVDDFINRKQGRAPVTYLHPKLEPILRSTYGVIVYQEQVMQIAQSLAGYTLGAADILRSAMGKKKPEEMAKQREVFCQGAEARGVAGEVATAIFDLMEKFAGYGFNKSHSVSYALIAYQTAWLKTHHPAAFMSAVLSSDMDRTEKILHLLEECKALGLTVARPDINESDFNFRVVDDKHLRYGLGAIKGMGEAAIENILAARSKRGPFTDLFDFCTRVDLRKNNRRVLEALIKSGCFDSLSPERASLCASLGLALQHAEKAASNLLFGQQDLLSQQPSLEKIAYIETSSWPYALQLQYEKETLGFYLSGHPLRAYQSEIAQLVTCPLSELAGHPKARIAGIILNIRLRQTKRGDRIAIFTLDDSTSQIEVVCFAECFQRCRDLLLEDQIVIVEGEISVDAFSQNLRIVAKEIYSLEQARERFARALQIEFKAQQVVDFELFKQLLNNYRGGNCPVIVQILDKSLQAKLKFSSAWQVKPSPNFISSLQDQLGVEKIQIFY